MIIASIQYYLFFGLALVVLGMAVFALTDVLRRPSAAFTYADKRTKGFWGGLMGLACVLAFLGLPTLGGSGLLFLILAAVPSGIYLADVRPAVRHYKDNQGGSSW